MLPTNPALLVAAAALALAACTVTTTGGGGTTTAGAAGQLRASVDGDLRRAGISDECINSLDTNELTLVRTMTNQPTRSSRELLQQRQQLRTFVGRYCPDL